MKINRTVLGWGAIVALIIVSGVISALWPTISAQLTGGGGGAPATGGGGPSIDTTIGTMQLPFALPVLGDQVNQLVVLALLSGLFLGAIVVTGAAIWFIYSRLDTFVVSTKTNTTYTSGVSALQSRIQTQVKDLSKKQPSDPVPDHDRARWLVISTALTLGLLLMFLGAAFSDEFTGGNNQFAISAAFGVVGVLVGLLALNVNRVKSAAASESQPLPGSVLWIVVTGLLVLGLIGVMMWVRTIG